MTAEIEEHLKELVRLYPNISSVWLIGSRANGTATTRSDYDLIVFADQEVLQAIKSNLSLNSSNVDLLVVFNAEGDFETPWGDKKRGSLKMLEWRESAITATYKSVKFTPDEANSRTGVFEEKILKGIKLYP